MILLLATVDFRTLSVHGQVSVSVGGYMAPEDVAGYTEAANREWRSEANIAITGSFSKGVLTVKKSA